MLETLSLQNSKWLSIACKICNDKQMAMDLVQDMYIKMHDVNEAYRAIHGVDRKVSNGYIYSVIRSLYIESYRGKSKQHNGNTVCWDSSDFERIISDTEDLLDIDDLCNQEADALGLKEVLESMETHKKIIVKSIYTVGFREYGRNSDIGTTTLQKIINSFKQTAWDNQKKPMDSETLSKQLQQLWELNLVSSAEKMRII